MKAIFPLSCIFLFPLFANAQGVLSPWDVSQGATLLAAQAEKLTPVLEKLKPEEWSAKGAPAAYVAQAQNARNESTYLIRAARSFEKQPEKLSLAIATYFRMQSLETMVNSLADGVRRYQDPRLGDELTSVVAANYGNRDRLRQYISDLADSREQEFKVMDSEAQRCRADLLRAPQSKPAAKAPAK
jgi:hypothetical protein